MKSILSTACALFAASALVPGLRAAGADDVVRIHHAVEVEHETEHGRTYTLQVSTNLTDWSDVGEAEPGHGGRERKLFPSSDDRGTPRFYRVVVGQGPTNGVAPASFAGWRLQLDDEPGGDLMDFLTDTNGVDVSLEDSDPFTYVFRQLAENDVRLDLLYSATRSNVLTLSFTATNAGTWICEEYRKGRLKDRDTGLFRVLGQTAGTPVVVSTNDAGGSATGPALPPAPPASLAGLLYSFQASGAPDRYDFTNDTGGLEIQGIVSEGLPTNGFAYTYSVTGSNTASLVMTFGYYGAGGDRYECDLTFTDGASGRFVRREFRKGRLKDTDVGAFRPQSLDGSNPGGGNVGTPVSDLDPAGAPPVSPVGLTFTMLSGNPPEALAFTSATAGVQRDDSAPSSFTYTYTSTGAGAFSLRVQFKADRWDEYDLTFTDGAHGTFVRREFQDGVLKDTDRATFIVATTAP